MKVLSNILVIWLLLNCSSQIINAKESVTAKLTSYFNVKVCSDNSSSKDVLILLDLGEVKKEDSLVAYEFILNYDTTKIKFLNVITMNTLSEFFGKDWVDINPRYAPGKLFCYGATIYPVSGKKPVVGIYGKYLQDCVDSTVVSLESLEFSDEYQKIVSDTINAVINVFRENNSKYFAESILNKNLLTFDKNLNDTLDVKLNFNPRSNIDKVTLKMFFDNDNFKITNVILKEKNLLLEKFEKKGDSTIIELSGLDSLDTDIISLVVEELKKDTNKLCKMTIKPEIYNNCNCILNFISDSVEFKSILRTDVSMHDLNNIEIRNKNNEIIIVNNKLDFIEKIEIFNLLGENVFRNDPKTSNYYINLVTYLKPGFYVLSIKTRYNDFRNRILINN